MQKVNYFVREEYKEQPESEAPTREIAEASYPGHADASKASGADREGDTGDEERTEKTLIRLERKEYQHSSFPPTESWRGTSRYAGTRAHDHDLHVGAVFIMPRDGSDVELPKMPEHSQYQYVVLGPVGDAKNGYQWFKCRDGMFRCLKETEARAVYVAFTQVLPKNAVSWNDVSDDEKSNHFNRVNLLNSGHMSVQNGVAKGLYWILYNVDRYSTTTHTLEEVRDMGYDTNIIAKDSSIELKPKHRWDD